MIPPGDIEDPGNARADFPNASEERNLRNISRHSRVLFERIHGTQGIWRVASSYRLKTTEPPHQRSSLSHAHHKLSAEYRRKKETNTSTQQEVPSFCLRKQGISVSSTSLQSEHCPSGIYRISSHKTLSYREVSQFMGSLNWASGLIPLGHLHLRPLQHFHSLGLTNRFSAPWRSDPVVLATLLRQWQNLSFSHQESLSDLSRRSSPFSQMPRPRAGALTWGILRLRVYGPVPNASSTSMYWSSNIGPQSLGYSITGSPCFDCYRQYHCCSLHQQTRWDPFPPPVAAGSGSVSVVSDSGHNSKSQTHSGLPKCESRPLVSAEPAHHDRVESPPRSRESDIQTGGNSSSGQVCHSPQHASSPVHGSSSRASSTDDRCFVTGLAGEVNVHVSTISPAQQSHSEAQDHPDGRGDTHRPLVAITTVVSTPAMIECGSPATILSVPQRPFVTTGLYLKRQVIPSACLEALMQHYQAAGFSREVSKFAAAPTCRRLSTNRMYDDRWLRFTTWATGRGFDQTIKGYRSCLASVLSRMGREAEV